MDAFWALPRYPFKLETIEVAPENSGVYALFDGEEVVYIGRALAHYGGIREALLIHFKSGRTGHVTAYTWEIHLSPEAREAILLARYIQEHLQVPRGHGRS